LFTTERTSTHLPDVDSGSKVTVVSSDFKSNPKTVTSEASKSVTREYISGSESSSESEDERGPERRHERDPSKPRKARKHQKERDQLWAKIKYRVLQPGVAGGIMGIINIGVISAVSYDLYSNPALRSNTRFLSTAAIGTVLLLSAEGVVAEAYRRTDAGRAEEKRARREGALITNRARDLVLRPGVMGGLVGVVNVGILGTVGYFGWKDWNNRHLWDRRTVSAVVIGLMAVAGGEGYLAEEYVEKADHHRRK